MANGISLARMVLAVPFAGLMLRSGASAALGAAVLFGIAIASDLLDGAVARRTGTVTRLGRALDHGADFVFVTAGLAAASLRGGIPWPLPVAVALAFLQYLVDSLPVGRGLEIRPSRLGRWNGVLYFFPLGGDLLVRLGWPALQRPVVWLSWALVVTTGLSIGDRLRWSLAARLRAAPGSPGGGRAARSRR